MADALALAGDPPRALAAEPRAAPVRLDSLQVLRAVAAMAVVLFHCNWTHIASFGVQLFFVLSGFIICHAAAADPRHFLLKRLFRVVPLYWAATLGIFALALIAPSLVQSSEPSAANLLRSLAFWPYARGDGEVMPLMFLGWTLEYEMFFYAVFAGCLACSHRLAPWLALAALLAVVAAHPLLAMLGTAGEFWSRPVLLNFCCGIAAFLAWPRLKAPLAAIPAPLAGALALALLAAFTAGLHEWPGGAFPWSGVLGAGLLLLLLRLDGALRWPAGLLLVGDASYSLYLLHPYALEAVNRLVHRFGPDPVGMIATLAGIALALALAGIAFRTVERPSNRALRRLLDVRLFAAGA